MSSGLELKPPSEAPSLDGMEADERVAAMVSWFFENFDDPVQETPYDGREGGYQFIWGGPYEASEELQETFSGAPEEDVEAAVAEIESDGLFEWAPSGNRIQPDDLDEEVDDEPTIEERLAALGAQLDGIEHHIAYWRNRAPSLGHNNPPEEFRLAPDDEDLFEAQQSVNELREELAKPDPANSADVVRVERAEGRFRKLAAKIAGWLKAGGATLALGVIGGIGKQIGEDIATDPSEFLRLLLGAAENLGVWAAHLQFPF